MNVQKNRQFSQEVRSASDFSGPFNSMIGGFYQKASLRDFNDVKLNDGSYNAAANRFVTYSDLGRQHGHTMSAFAQASYDITPKLELAGGAR